MPPTADREIELVVEHGDVQAVSDVLALKHAQTLVGADAAVVAQLEAGGVRVRHRLPSAGAVTLVPSSNVLGASSVLFVGVEPLGSFDYAGIREFGRRALEALVHEAPGTERVTIAVHGPGYGLDEAEALRAERMRSLLESLLPNRSYTPVAHPTSGDYSGPASIKGRRVGRVGSSSHRPGPWFAPSATTAALTRRKDAAAWAIIEVGARRPDE